MYTFNMLACNTKTVNKLTLECSVYLGFLKAETGHQQTNVTNWFSGLSTLPTGAAEDPNKELFCDVQKDLKKYK